MGTKWIDAENSEGRLQAGDMGFLVCQSNQLKGWETWTLRLDPARTNVSRQPRLHGWCGSYNDTATHAHGIAKVQRISASGARACIELLSDDDPEAVAFIEASGYPELITEGV